MTLLLCIYVASGLFMSLLSLPMILGWLNPNPYYGFRVKQTLEDPEVWRVANRFSGWRLCVAGLVIAGAAVAFFSIPGQRIDWYAYQCLGVTAVSLGWAVLSSFFFLRLCTHSKDQLPKSS